MSDNPRDAYHQAQSRLGGFPRLRNVFEFLYNRISLATGVSVLLSGSVASGNVDELSDLDLELIVHDAANRQKVRDDVDRMIRELAKPIAHFPATHLGLRELEVYFLDYESTVVKVDIWTADMGSLPLLLDAALIHDPGGVVAQARARLRAHSSSDAPADYDDLHHKFCGWMWFTAVKIRRGHLFEAVESLDFMRSYALLPLLHAARSNPLHGYRHLEQRLASTTLAELRETYPSRHDHAEITRAFGSLVDLFRRTVTDVEAHLGRSLNGGDLARMTESVQGLLRSSFSP